MAASQAGPSTASAGASQRFRLQLEPSVIVSQAVVVPYPLFDPTDAHFHQGKLKQAKVFEEAVDRRAAWTSTAHEGYSTAAQITSIAFDSMGELCVTASEDEAFSVWDATKGK